LQDAIQTAVGGNAISRVLQDEQRYDLVMRYLPQYGGTTKAIEKIRLLAPSNERVSPGQFCKMSIADGGSGTYANAVPAPSRSSTPFADAISAPR
jgi:cobalt-zinc-cadmium resistance protein CzcA